MNAFVPLGSFMNKLYGILDADVNVVHNIQKYRLKDNNTLNRKFCTLEKSGPQLLKFLNKKNFTVNYTVVPYTGVSIIDFRFHFGLVRQMHPVTSLRKLGPCKCHLLS